MMLIIHYCIEKLPLYGYLKQRIQFVQVESKISDPLEVPWGVPRGSKLGPLLFSRQESSTC